MPNGVMAIVDVFFSTLFEMSDLRMRIDARPWWMDLVFDVIPCYLQIFSYVVLLHDTTLFSISPLSF